MNRGDSKNQSVANQLFEEQLATKSNLINLNTATSVELETLTGIGVSTAKKILDYREKNGKFKSIEEIKNVSGIGDAKYAAIKDDITV